MAADAAALAGHLEPDALRRFGGSLIVTPQDIDTRIRDVARVIGYGLSLVLHPALEIEDIAAFTA